MSLVETMDSIYDLVSMFYTKAEVVWAEQIMTKPTPPYVTLKLGAISKTTFQLQDETGDKAYQCSTILELNQYTKGLPVKTAAGKVTTNTINTATSDLLDFIKFLESEEVQLLLQTKNIAVELMGNVRDLSELQNETKYRYRALAEFEVRFVEYATGRYGISDMSPSVNSSGGGNAAMASETELVITDVEIKESEGGSEDE